MLFKHIREDLKYLSDNGSFINKLKIIIIGHGFHLSCLFRASHFLGMVWFIGPLLGKILEYIIRILYASDISYKAKIDGGFLIIHGHDIVIGENVQIGKNCTIFNGVTLGNKDIVRPVKSNQPIIGNNVFLGTGAKILGNITIGDNVIVGANSVVTKNLPNNVVVAGIPAKIIKQRKTKNVI